MSQNPCIWRYDRSYFVHIFLAQYDCKDRFQAFSMLWGVTLRRGYGVRLRACLKSSDKDSNEGKSKNLSRNTEFALTIFPKPAEFVEPAEKVFYHPAARQYDKFV